MHYLPLPRTVVPAIAVATSSLVIWLVWGSIHDPESFWAPGDLSRYHAGVSRCTSCHEPFQGIMTAKCITCHYEASFVERPMPLLAAFHQELIRTQHSCFGCHTEHRGPVAEITSRSLWNPHGAFVFTATGTTSCMACHVFGATYGARPTVIDNDTVRSLLAKGGTVHRRGHMANCLQCHGGDSRIPS
ncbi:MAG TPA: cytochrome c3 family protein [Nitrospira sp.]|nr:cytochrome c3 family protein [Nitrospira sp.]